MTTLVTGGSGMVGKFLQHLMPSAIFLSSKDCDLTSQESVKKLFKQIKPQKVIHAAARVGGITENIKYPSEFLEQNILMNTFVLKECLNNDVDYCVSILSTCIYPDICGIYPMSEEQLFNGPPTSTNFSYAYAKRSLAVYIDSINKQYNKKYNYLIPCNLYGEYDKFDENSHYVSSLIRKIYTANKNCDTSIQVYGDGSPLRQFMHAEDLAKIIQIFIEQNIRENCNVSNNEVFSIKEIAEIAIKTTNSNLQIKFDTNKPNGQFRKDVDNKKLLKIIGKYEFIKLSEGIERVYRYYDKTCK